MQMTSDSINISLLRVYFSIGNFCVSRFGDCSIGLAWEAKTASGLSNRSAEPNHVCAHTTQLRICNNDSIVIVTLRLCMQCVYRVLYAFKVLTPSCGTVSFPL